MDWATVVGLLTVSVGALAVVREWPAQRGRIPRVKRDLDIVALLPADSSSRQRLLASADAAITAELDRREDTDAATARRRTVVLSILLLGTIPMFAGIIMMNFAEGDEVRLGYGLYALGLLIVAGGWVTMRVLMRGREQQEPPVLGGHDGSTSG